MKFRRFRWSQGLSFTTIFILSALFFSLTIYAHGSGGSFSKNENGDRPITFPDTQQHKTLVTDLHTHSVFSDGHVWPNIRVGEALRDGLKQIFVLRKNGVEEGINELLPNVKIVFYDENKENEMISEIGRASCRERV